MRQLFPVNSALLADYLFQAPAFQPLHDQDDLPGEIQELVNRSDGWMVQRSSQTRFLEEALPHAHCSQEFRPDDLYCHFSAKNNVMRLVNAPHSSFVGFA